ncbi:MAG TPA: protein kinase [Labilithrix sp.]
MTTNAAIERVVAAKRIGSFRIVAPLGEGGFAPVFLASEEYGGVELRTVALKLFAVDDLAPVTMATDGERAARSARDRILEEARALCRVDHPNVVRFFQIVEERDVLGLAMEHVRGRSLASRLDEHGSISVDETLTIGVAVASALAAVHAAGLVHRDVKPPNVIESGGVYKLIDFGIALRQRGAASPRKHTSTGAVAVASMPPISRSGTTLESGGMVLGATMPLDVAPADATNTVDDEVPAGTMGYIDPMCIARELPADASSDLYSLGAMLYECLTGRVPAAAGERAVTTRLRPTIVLGVDAPPGVRTLRPDVSEDVAKLVDSLVVPERTERPARAEVVAAELGRLARVARGRARPLPADGPFRGLAPVDLAHRDVYFGRALAVAAALELLRARGMIALVGASGAGKTSLALAGVLPAIAEGALGAWPDKWTTAIFAPGRAPREAFARAVGIEIREESADDVARELATLVTTRGEGLLVLVDALEELVTIADGGEARWLGALLARVASRPAPGLRFVCTARRDLLDPLLADAELGPALARGMQLVVPLDARAWIDSVRERAAAYGVTLEEGVEDALASELGAGAVPLPLVEFAMARAWTARAGSVLPRAAFAAMGGLGGALARHAEEMVETLVREHGAAAADAVRQILVALTTPHGTRSRLSRRELADRVSHPLRDVALAALERARLVTADDDLTLAHDALVTRWPRLGTWVKELRRDRELAADLETAASRWKARPARDNLVRGRTLADGRAVARSNAVRLSDDARALLRASARDELRGRVGVFALLGSVLAAGVVLAWVYSSSERETQAEKERAAEISRTLIAAKKMPKSAVEKAIEDLLQKNNACEKELAKCGVDGGP